MIIAVCFTSWPGIAISLSIRNERREEHYINQVTGGLDLGLGFRYEGEGEAGGEESEEQPGGAGSDTDWQVEYNI